MDTISQLLKSCTVRDKAPTETIRTLHESIAGSLPEDYWHFLGYADGAEGFVGENYVSLWPAAQVLECGRYESVPHFLFLGSDGGGEGFAFDLRESPASIVNVPFIGMHSEEPRLLGRTLLEFLERLTRAPLFEGPSSSSG